MDQFSNTLNELLEEVYQNILRMEEVILKKKGKIPLSINEIHLIERVGKAGENGLTLSELAQALGITKPSATVAVNKLEKKGYLVKHGSESDGRIVRILLTHQGKVVDHYHRYYHRKMVSQLSAEFTEEEQDCLIRALDKLNNYFKSSIGDKK